MKIPKWKKKNPYQSTKPTPIWTDWYPKNNPNPSKFRNLNFGEKTNQTINRNQLKPWGWVHRRRLKTTPQRLLMTPRRLQRRGRAPVVRGEEEMAWCIGKVFSRSASVYVFGNFRWVWVIILCYKVHCFLINYLTWQFLIGGVNKPFSASSGQNVFSFVFGFFKWSLINS